MPPLCRTSRTGTSTRRFTAAMRRSCSCARNASTCSTEERRPMIGLLVRSVLTMVALLIGVIAPAAQAAVGGLPTAIGHADSSPEWERLRGKLFGTRPIDATSGRVQLLVPLRAAYGASVPVKIVSKLPQIGRAHV